MEGNNKGNTEMKDNNVSLCSLLEHISLNDTPRSEAQSEGEHKNTCAIEASSSEGIYPNSKTKNMWESLKSDASIIIQLDEEFKKLKLINSFEESCIQKESNFIKTRGPQRVKSKPLHAVPYGKEVELGPNRTWQCKLSDQRTQQYTQEGQIDHVCTEQIKQFLCLCTPCSVTIEDHVKEQSETANIVEDEVLEDVLDMNKCDAGYSSWTDTSYSSSPTDHIDEDQAGVGLTREAKKKKKRNKYLNDFDSNKQRNAENLIKSRGLNHKDKQNRTLLHNAIEQGKLLLAIVFINKVEFKYKHCVQERDSELRDFQDKVAFLDQKDNYGHTPLLLACKHNMHSVVSYLLELGVSPILNDSHNKGSILHFVCERGRSFLRVAKAICETAKWCINSTNERKQTPLHIAVSFHNLTHRNESEQKHEIVNNKPIIELLLKNGANLAMQDEYGRTALHIIAFTNNIELISCAFASVLTTKEWNEAINMQDNDGMTVLHRAVLCRGLEPEKQEVLIKKLVSLNASPLIKDASGKLPIDYVLPERNQLCLILSV